jgi:hypothetical protein
MIRYATFHQNGTIQSTATNFTLNLLIGLPINYLLLKLNCFGAIHMTAPEYSPSPPFEASIQVSGLNLFYYLMLVPVQ